MRLSPLSVVALLALSGVTPLAAQQSSPTQPFGLRLGTPLETIRDQWGATQYARSFNGWFKLARVPSPAAPFDLFQVFVSPVSGLCTVIGVSSAIESGQGGAEARRAFSAVRDSLDAVYGKSSLLQSVVSTPLYTAPDQWMLSLYYRERTYLAVWNAGSGRFPPELSQISLNMEAASESAARLALTFYRARSRACKDEVTAAVLSSP